MLTRRRTPDEAVVSAVVCARGPGEQDLRQLSPKKINFNTKHKYGNAVWNYPFDTFLVTIEPIDYSDERIPKTGKSVIYRFRIGSSAFPKKNIDISDIDARKYIYGMPYEEWKNKFQK